MTNSLVQANNILNELIEHLNQLTQPEHMLNHGIAFATARATIALAEQQRITNLIALGHHEEANRRLGHINTKDEDEER